MTLKAILDKIDDLPDALKSEYVEKNGKFELSVEGMKTQGDVDRVNEALRKEKSDFSAYKGRFAPLDGKKVEDILATLDRVPELEAAAAGKLDDAKINEIVETRIKTRLGPVERERDQLKVQLGEKEKTIGEYTAVNKTRSVHDAIRQAATVAKVLPEALDDALMLAERHFEVTDDGRVVTKDGVGVTPGIEATAWFSDLQSKRRHWWGQTTGGGSGGSRGGAGGANNPFSDSNWNMTQQGEMVRSNLQLAEQMAKAAGTTIGGQRPKPKT